MRSREPWSKARLSLAAALATMFVWGVNFAFVKHVLDGIGVEALMFVRFAVLPLLGFALLLVIFRRRIAHTWPRRRDLPRFIVAGLIGHAAHIGVVMYGMSLSTPFSSSLVLTSGPLFTLIILAVLKVERLRMRQVAGTLVALAGTLEGLPIVACGFEFKFLGGSMGSVVGERFVRGVQVCLEQKLPFVCFTASGGARMQEGLLSLMQMSKTCAALTQLGAEKLPFISVLTDPTMGGVSASFALIGDVVFAEPNALIGFAGPRVIEQTVRETLPEGFQRAEFLLGKGALDMIIDRRQLRPAVAKLLSMLLKQSADAVA